MWNLCHSNAPEVGQKWTRPPGCCVFGCSEMSLGSSVFLAGVKGAWEAFISLLALSDPTSSLIISDLCHSTRHISWSKWSKMFIIFFRGWWLFHLWRELYHVSNHFFAIFVIIFVCLDVQALTSSLKLSAYFHLQRKCGKCIWSP